MRHIYFVFRRFFDRHPFIVLFVFCVLLFILAMIPFIIRLNQMKRYRKITIGMTENEMLNIMGGRPIKSSLKNNRFKYEWRINASSTTSGSKGVYTTTYSGVKKVDIYTKDGYVEEIKPYNI